MTLVITKDPLKKLHYCQLFDRDTPISEFVMLTGYSQVDLALQRVETHDHEVRVYLSGGDYSVIVKVDVRRGAILSPSDGRPATPAPPQERLPHLDK